MREDWKQVIGTCKSIAKQTGVKLPDIFDNQPAEGQPAGRTFADPLLYNQVMVRNLAGFLVAVEGKLQADDPLKTHEIKTPEGKKGK